MANVFIIHGTGGYPEENWFPWLNNELTKLGHNVFVPQFPTPENQTLENWFNVFEKYKEHYDKETILVGHSLGGAFSLRVLEKYDTQIKAAFIVAAPCGKVASFFPGANKTDLPFVGHPFNWNKIKSNAKKIFVFQSDNDPYIDKGNAKEIAQKTKGKLILIPGAGHFNAKAGYLKFEYLLDLMKKELLQ